MVISNEYRKIIELLILEKSYKEIQDEMNLRQGQLQIRMRRLRKAFGAKNSIGVVVRYLNNERKTA